MNRAESISLAVLVLATVLNVALRTRTPEEWIALGEAYPRTKAAIKVLRAVFPDLPGALRALQTFLNGKAGGK